MKFPQIARSLFALLCAQLTVSGLSVNTGIGVEAAKAQTSMPSGAPTNSAPSATSTAPTSSTPIPTEQQAPSSPASLDEPVVEPEVAPNGPPAKPLKRRKARIKKLRDAKKAPLDSDYGQPLRFAPEDNGLSINNPQMRFAMDNPNSVNLGGLKIPSEAISITVDQISRDKASVRFDDSGAQSKLLTTLSFRWPELLSRTGLLTIETLSGEVKWSKDITLEDRKAWKTELDYATAEMKKPHLKHQFGLIDIRPDQFDFLYKGGRFRACLTKENSELEKLKLCTKPFLATSKGDVLRFNQPKGENTEHGVYLSDKNLGETGLINFKPGTAVVLKIAFGDFSFIEIGSQPADPKLLDVVESPDGNEIILTGHGAKPLGKKVRIISKPVTHFWAPTGIPQEQIWQVGIPRDTPVLRLLGVFSIPFTMLLTYDELPKESDRVYIRSTRSSGTYSEKPIIFGYAPSGARVSSTESFAKSTSAKYFEWEFLAPRTGELHKSRLLVRSLDHEREWVAHHRMYRSFPYELSARLTGILASDFTFIMMGEVSGAAWFESLGFTQNNIFSKQRWGVAGRYFKTLTAIESSTGAKIDDFTVANFDLKYNLLPGIWHRDEIVGLSLSSQQVTLAGTNATFGGVGAYWARTMPRIFNDLFNFVPGFDYPKYVDMEFIYYPLSMTSNMQPAGIFNLNFHGRVFWSHRFYGEAGFGLRRYAYTFPSPVRPGVTAGIDLSSAYGTAGIGFVF